jgi:hypothetical protein
MGVYAGSASSLYFVTYDGFIVSVTEESKEEFFEGSEKLIATRAYRLAATGCQWKQYSSCLDPTLGLNLNDTCQSPRDEIKQRQFHVNLSW